MKKILMSLFGAGLSLAALCPSSARAAAVAYDKDNVLVLDSVVRSVDWSGPQLKLVVGSFDGHGGAPDWTITGPDPTLLFHMGWTKDLLKVGEKLDTVINPDKDGSRNGSLLRFYLFDGRTLETSPFGTTHIVPLETLAHMPKTPGENPMAGYYGNTIAFKAADYNGHVWFNADGTFTMFSNDKNPDGTWSERLVEGYTWFEKQQDKYIQCMYFATGRIAPFCHSPVNFEKVGDQWTVVLPGGWSESRVLLPGRQ